MNKFTQAAGSGESITSDANLKLEISRMIEQIQSLESQSKRLAENSMANPVSRAIKTSDLSKKPQEKQNSNRFKKTDHSNDRELARQKERKI